MSLFVSWIGMEQKYEPLRPGLCLESASLWFMKVGPLQLSFQHPGQSPVVFAAALLNLYLFFTPPVKAKAFENQQRSKQVNC